MFFSPRGACGGILAEQVARGEDLTTHFPFAARGNKRCLAASKGEQVTVNVGTGASLITKVNMNSARSQAVNGPGIFQAPL